MVAIFQPIFSFIHCYHLQFHRRFQPFPLLSFAIPIAPFHTVSLGSFTPPPSLPPPVFFFCFTPLRSLQPVLFANPLFRRSSFGSQTVHTRELSSTRNGISLSLGSSLFSSLSLLALAPLLEAPLLIANMPITVIYKRRAPTPRLFSFQISTRIDESFDPSFRSRFSLPSVVFFLSLLL